MTDPGTADRTYIGPMTPELVEQILDKVSVPSVLISCYLPVDSARCLPNQQAVLLLTLFCPYTGAARRNSANYGWPDCTQPGQGTGRGVLSMCSYLVREHCRAEQEQHVCVALRPIPALLLAVSCTDLLV